MIDEWAQKDPIARYERHLRAHGVASQDELDAITARIDAALLEDLAWAEQSPLPEGDSAMDGVYAGVRVADATPPLVVEWEKAGRPTRRGPAR
jgi:pyruvate dehydrogenase E1 component alpha subunit